MMDNWPVGLMDKASASGAGDSRFESWADHFAQRYLFGYRGYTKFLPSLYHSGISAVGSA